MRIFQPALTPTPFRIDRVDGAHLPTILEYQPFIPARIASVSTAIDARIKAGDAVVFTADGQSIAMTAYMVKLEDINAPEPLNTRQPDFGGRPIFVAYNAGWRNYYHLLIQAGFSTWAFSTYLSSIDGRFLFPGIFERGREILSMCGANESNSVFAHKNLNVHLPLCHYLETTYAQYVYTPSTLMREYSDHLVAASGATDRLPRKLYISRRDSRNRVLENEAQIEEVAAAHGYEVATLSNMSFVAQIELFRSADVIVAPHGAGLSNTLFCRPGAEIIELTFDGYVNSCFLRLSQVLGLRHRLCVFPSQSGVSASTNGIGAHRTAWTIGRMDYLSYLIAQGL